MRNWLPSRPRLALVFASLAAAGLSLSNYDRMPPGASAPPAPKLKEAYAIRNRPTDLITLAWLDAQQLSEYQRCYTRYLAVQDEEEDSMRTSSLALNYVSRAATIQRPLPLFGIKLLRLDLRLYFPQHNDLEEALRIWEEFAFDPMFSLLVTKDTLQFLKDQHISLTQHVGAGGWRTETKTVQHAGGDYHYPDDSGRVKHNVAPGSYEVELRYKTPGKQVDIDVLRVNPGHIDPIKLADLQHLLHTEAPVVDHRYFKVRGLSQIQDKGVFKKVLGGLYYRLRGIRKSTDPNVTDQDLFFQDFLHIGNIKGKLNADALFNLARSDQRSALRRSNITGHPRIALELPTLAEREGAGRGWITLDIRREDIDSGDRGFANLLHPRVKGQEGIFPGANSLPVCIALNGDGDLVDLVPQNIASDRTIPAPYEPELQPIISCLRCHTIDSSDFWKPIGNDVKKLLSGRLDVFGELSVRGREFDPDTFDRLAGLYAGSKDKNLRRARDDVSEATLKATGNFASSPDQTDVCKVSGQRLADEYAKYLYEQVNAHQALLEMGYVVPEARALEIFNRLLPPDGRSELPPGILGSNPGAIPEDSRIALIKNGLDISRADFSLAFAFMAERAQKSVQENLKAGLTWWGDKPK